MSDAPDIRALPLQFRSLFPHWKMHTPHHRQPINWVLIDDVETTSADLMQRALFGWAQLRTVRQNDDGTLTTYTVREVLYYADDLPTFRPVTFECLKQYAESHSANVDMHFPSCEDFEHGQLDVTPVESIIFIPHSEFVREYIGGICYNDVPNPEYSPAMLVGFNYSFDIFRHALKKITRPTGFFHGGLGATLTGYGERGESWELEYRETRAGIGYIREFIPKRRTDRNRDRPVSNIVDLAQLVRAMTSKPHSLLSAGRAFGCKTLKYDGAEIHDPEHNSGLSGTRLRRQIMHYIGYARNDVAATAELWEKVVEKFRRHPIDLPENQAFSAASLDKQYLRDMGIHAPMCACTVPKGCSEKCCRDRHCDCGDCKQCGNQSLGCKDKKRGGLKIPADVLSRAMGAFYGGRAFCNIRMMHLIIVLCDFCSMYPTQMLLTGIWEMLTAESIICRDETDDVIRLIDSLTLKDLYRPETHHMLAGIADVIADGGDWLPVRSPYNDAKNSAPGIGIQYIDTIGKPVPWTLADIAASKIRTGKTPNIVRAWRFYPSEDRQSTLKPIDFNGDPKLRFDPATMNLPRFLVEEKALAKKRHKTYQGQRPLSDPSRPRKRIYEDSVREMLQPIFDLKVSAGTVTERDIQCMANLQYPDGMCDCPAHHALWQLQNSYRSWQDQNNDPRFNRGTDAEIASMAETWQKNLAHAERVVRETHAHDANVRAWHPDPKQCLAECCDTEYSLKILVNAIYGIFAQMDSTSVGIDKGTVYGINGEKWDVTNPEMPGEYCFPVFAAIITGGARLFLAMLEQEIIDRKSALVFGDTDSACIPANGSGRTQDGVRSLSYRTIDQIRSRFNKLNPYDMTKVDQLLTWEQPKRDGDQYPDRPLYGTAISAKRYGLSYRVKGDLVIMELDDETTDDQIEDFDGLSVAKESKHGLGLYANPMTLDASLDKEVKDGTWFKDAWEYMTLRYVLGNRSAPKPDWLDRPAISKFPVRSRQVYDVLDQWLNYQDCERCGGSGTTDTTNTTCARCKGAGRVHKPVNECVIPGSFFLAYYPSRASGLSGSAFDYGGMRLIAPFERDPSKWGSLTVTDIKSGRKFRVTTKPEDIEAARDTGEAVILVKSYREVIWEYITHPEIKSNGPDGKPCRSDTRGILQPCQVAAMGYQYITKDSSSLHTAGEAYLYGGPRVYRDNSDIVAISIAKQIIKDRGYGKIRLANFTSTTVDEARTFLSDNASRNRPGTETSYLAFAAELVTSDILAVKRVTDLKFMSSRQILTLYLTIKRDQEMERVHDIINDMLATAATSDLDNVTGIFGEYPRIRELVGKSITIHEVREFESRWLNAGNPDLRAAVLRFERDGQQTICYTSGNLARQALTLSERGELPATRQVGIVNKADGEHDRYYLKKVRSE